MGYGTVTATGTRFNWYAATLDDLTRFSLQVPLAGCSVRATTTATANAHKCVVAANSGFFQFSPKPTYCLGELVIDSSIVEWADDGSPMIAVTHNTTVLGPLTKDEVSSMGIVHGVSGFGIVQLHGKPHPPGIEEAGSRIKALRPSAEEVAPRTIAALDASGRLIIVAIDGVEALNLGITLTEAADIFSGGATGFPFKTLHAINLDGGGSTTLSASPVLSNLLPAQIYNRPTDTDTGPISERSVTCIFCIKE
jgi:exopolysaccharide biosynthesis protein